MNNQDEHRDRARRRAPVAVAATVTAVAATLVVLVSRVEVEGDSMLPSLRPGDRLVVVRVPSRWRLRRGQVVALWDPRAPGARRRMVKRVATVGSGSLTVLGDNAAASTDSRAFGPVDRQLVLGIVVHRYVTAPSPP